MKLMLKQTSRRKNMKQNVRNRYLMWFIAIAAPLATIFVVGQTMALISFQIGGNNANDTLPPGTVITPNPTLVTKTCNQGLNIALVVDASGSMQGSTSSMQNNLRAFVNNMNNPVTGSFSNGVKMSLTYFAGNLIRMKGQSLTDKSSLIHRAIDNLTGVSPGTEWVDGLKKGYATLPTSSASPRLIIIMTDGAPTDGIANAVRQANFIKSQGVRIMAIGVQHPAVGNAPASTFAKGSNEYKNLQAITNGDDSSVNTADVTSSAFPDMLVADVNGALGNELRKIAGGTCVGPGDGNGIGNNGVGTGNSGIGKGKKGAGLGLSPQSPTPNPTPAPAPSATVSNKPNPAPTPTAQGIRVTPPPPPPSPFYDGKQYEPGSENITFAQAALAGQNILLWIGGAAGVATLAGIGGWFWMRSKKKSTKSRK